MNVAVNWSSDGNIRCPMVAFYLQKQVAWQYFERVLFITQKNILLQMVSNLLKCVGFFSRTSGDLHTDVEASRRIEYDGLRQVIFFEIGALVSSLISTSCLAWLCDIFILLHI